MELSVRHLISRRGVYYFRYRLPGKNLEIKVSLRTGDLKKAVATGKLASEKLRSLIDSGVARMIPKEEIQKRITDFIKNELEEQERHFAGFGPICEGTRADARKSMLKLSAKTEEAILNNDTQAWWGRGMAQELFKDLNPEEAELNVLTRAMLNAMLYLARVQRERLEGKRFSSEFSENDYQTILSGSYPRAQEIIASEHVDAIGDLAKQYLDAPHQWCVKGALDVKNTLELLCEYYGKDTDIRKLTKREMRNFRDNVLMKLPARRNVLPQFKGMTLQQCLACKDAKTLSLQTVNHRLADLSGFFTWCVEGEYIAANPVSGLQLEINGKVSNERLPYSSEELQKIFTLLREDKLNAWAPFKLWIPLIMLYCGCRQNEVCQLFTDNVLLINGIPCFEFIESEETGARVKNESSIRATPIHPFLLQLGFLEYAAKRKFDRRNKKGTAVQLWPQMDYNPKDGYARRFRVFFEDFNRKYITKEPKKSCYSLRHNFIDNLKQQGIQETIVSEICGHVTGSKITYRRYGSDLNTELKRNTMKKLNLGFDIFETLGKKPLSYEAVQAQISRYFA